MNAVDEKRSQRGRRAIGGPENAMEASGSLERLQLLRIRDAARVAGLSASFLYLAAERGDLTVHRFGRSVRVSVADLEAFVARARIA